MQSTTESNNNGNNLSKTAKRGFASMDRAKQREIASKGGKAVSNNHEHMSEIGRRGGEASGETRRNRNERSHKKDPGELAANNDVDDIRA